MNKIIIIIIMITVILTTSIIATNIFNNNTEEIKIKANYEINSKDLTIKIHNYSIQTKGNISISEIGEKIKETESKIIKEEKEKEDNNNDLGDLN